MAREVAFHTGIADPLGYACRLLRKAARQGARVVVSGSPETLARLDPLLWTFEPLEFVPHVRLRAGQGVAPEMVRTPIWLADPGTAAPEAAVLVNLGPGLREGWQGYERVIELVGAEPAQRQEGRLRWRTVEAAGQTITHHPQTA